VVDTSLTSDTSKHLSPSSGREPCKGQQQQQQQTAFDVSSYTPLQAMVSLNTLAASEDSDDAFTHRPPPAAMMPIATSPIALDASPSPEGNKEPRSHKAKLDKSIADTAEGSVLKNKTRSGGKLPGSGGKEAHTDI
jgi:hypothetical protein